MRCREEIEMNRSVIRQPWYARTWDYLKQFPKGIAQGHANPPDVSGTAAAALISAAIGCVTMMVAHHLSDTSKAREQALLSLGSWIPGAQNPDPIWGNIGSYAGKETMLLMGWIVSWLILHSWIAHKQVKVRTLFVWLLGLMTIATVMCWHPLFPYLPLM
jgi:hypothetical protein